MFQSQKHVDVTAISPVSLTAGSNVTANFDFLGAKYADVRVLVSNIATPTVASASGATVSILSANDTNSSNFATIVADRTGIKTARHIRYTIDNRTGKRYGRINLTAGSAGVSNDTVLFAAVATVARNTENITSIGALSTTTTNDTALAVTI